jgi:hypothetical protein
MILCGQKAYGFPVTVTADWVKRPSAGALTMLAVAYKHAFVWLSMLELGLSFLRS